MSVFHPALFIVGVIALMFSLLMVLPVALLAFGEHPDWAAFVTGSGICLASGLLLVFRFRGSLKRLRPRELFLITVMSWIAASCFGALPFMLSDYHFTAADAFFETVSGITTTGSTVIVGLDSMPSDILLWRSLLTWLGGIGVIGMAVAVLPFLQVGGMRLFKAESSDWSEKALPRARVLAKSLVLVYLVLSVLCAAAYVAAGMDLFDAVNHAMCTIATGGFSVWDSSFGHYRSSMAIHWIGILFMVLGALPFVLYVRFWGQFRPGIILNDSQVRGFLLLLILASLSLAFLQVHTSGAPLAQALTLAAFNVTSIVTTTGFVSGDYSQWGSFAVAVFFFLAFVGGCSGSTSGGMKIFRFQLSLILVHEQVRKLLHPHGVFSRLYNGRKVPGDIIVSAVAFSFMYFMAVVVITLILAVLGLDLVTSLSGAASALGNIGPGLGGIIGPVGTFKSLPDAAKWVLSAGMLLGRLELLAFVVVLTADFWKD
ncbi:MAG TPA: TrkH family potassium uptake protein [Gammaproteobacteria bacterium]|nr:TrkH family potassium uptake protein [Gammaproteobacteria bacterium]